MKFKAISLIILILSMIHSARAEDDSRNVIFTEIDPLVLIMGGFGGHVGWAPKGIDNFIFGLGFVAGPELPEAISNIGNDSPDNEWQLKINNGIGLWVNYRFGETKSGWFTGFQVFTQEMELRNKNYAMETDLTNTFLLALQGGYQWYPWDNSGIFIKPWAGFGYQFPVSGSLNPDEIDKEMSIGGKDYNLLAIMPFATIHIGYSF
jgi:hypothetical protein